MAQFSKQKLDVETAVHIAVQALNLSNTVYVAKVGRVRESGIGGTGGGKIYL